MKFDVVIGNPPYNNDIYIPFVEKGHELAKQCSCFITPAKWQERDNKDNNEINRDFRLNILPYFKKMKYYQVEGEVFGINMSSGIGYYILDKTKKDTFLLENMSSHFESFRHNEVSWSIERTIYNIKAYDIIEKIVSNNFKSFMPNMNSEKKHKIIGQKARYNLGGSSNKDGRGIFYYNRKPNDGVFQPAWVNCTPRYSDDENEILGAQETVIESFDSKDEALSFMSYINRKLIRYINAVSLFGRSIYTLDAWRFVPDPGAFDHIFTDEELYKKYNLTEEEINIIEKVIKKRD